MRQAIRYTNIVPVEQRMADIFFAVTKGQDTDRSYTIYNKGRMRLLI